MLKNVVIMRQGGWTAVWGGDGRLRMWRRKALLDRSWVDGEEKG